MSDAPERKGAAPLPEKAATPSSSKPSDSTMPSEGKAPFIPLWMDQAGLTPHEFRILAHLWSRGRGRCYPGQETIAKCCRMELKTARKAIGDLVAMGHVTREKRKFSGVRNSYEYFLNIPNGTLFTNGQTDQKAPGLNIPNGTLSKPTKWHPMNDTSLNESSLNETSLFREEELPTAEFVPSKLNHELFDYWNSFKEIPHIKEISQARKFNLKTRMKDDFFRENWRSAIDKIVSNPFLRGEGPRRWKATIDWFLKPDSVIRIVEGTYDNQPSKPTAQVNLGGRTRQEYPQESLELPD